MPPLLMDQLPHHQPRRSPPRRSGAAASLLPCPLAELGRGRLPARLSHRLRAARLAPAAQRGRDHPAGGRLHRRGRGHRRRATGCAACSRRCCCRPTSCSGPSWATAAGPDGVVRLTDFELAVAAVVPAVGHDPRRDPAGPGRRRDGCATRRCCGPQAQRLLRVSRRAAPVFAAFVRQWLKIEDLARLRKDRKRVPHVRQRGGRATCWRRTAASSTAWCSIPAATAACARC